MRCAARATAARRRVRVTLAGLPAAVLLAPAAIAAGEDAAAKAGAQALAPAAALGTARALSQLGFAPDDDVPCLGAALEAGDPDHGPSTLMLRAPRGCLVKWHWHSAEEQVIVIRGRLRMEMDGHSPGVLDGGGFAVMPGGVAHQFVCESAASCLVAVSFNARYDIFWGRRGR